MSNYAGLSDNIRVNSAQAAAFLGIKASTLCVWRTTGRYNLSYIKVGRLVQYELGVLRQFLRNRTGVHTGEFK